MKGRDVEGSPKVQNIFFLSLLALVLLLNLVIFWSYLAPIIVAVTLAVMVYPVYKKILRGTGKPTFAALLTTFFVLVVVLAPLSFFGWRLFLEAKSVYDSLSAGDGTINSWVNSLGSLKQFADNLNLDLARYLQNGASAIVSHFGTFFSSLFRLIFNFVLVLFGTFFFLRDGEKFKKALMTFSPLPVDVENKILNRLENAVDSVIRGQLTIAVIQGILASLGFALFGLPSPLLWGSLAIFAALVPSFGTSLVLVPAVLYVYFTGHLASAIGLALWSALAVGLIDNFLQPVLIHRHVRVHMFLIFLSVVGGISVFGPVGFLIGPLAVVLLLTLLDIRASYGK